MSTISFPFKVGNGLKIVIVKQEKSFESVDGTVVETLTTVPAEEFVEVRDSQLSHQSLVYIFFVSMVHESLVKLPYRHQLRSILRLNPNFI